MLSGHEILHLDCARIGGNCSQGGLWFAVSLRRLWPSAAGSVTFWAMKSRCHFPSLRDWVVRALPFLAVLGMADGLHGQTAPTAPEVPDWALPSSPTHVQTPPPAGFHRASKNFDEKLGMFTGRSEIGAPLAEGSANYDAATGQYTVRAAGYNIWYQRDEFGFVWKKMSGDLSLAADISFPDAQGYGDRKCVLVIRQSLDDDAKEAMVGEHGTGMIHLAWRGDEGAQMKDMTYRFGGVLNGVHAQRIGIEKRGDTFSIFVSLTGEPMHQLGPSTTVHLDGPFYVGIGFCSHLAATVDAGTFAKVELENKAGKVR